MPKKRQSIKHAFKPPQTAHHAEAPRASAAPARGTEPKSVNELLAGLRRAHAGSASSASSTPSFLQSPSPTLPPALRQLLQLPDMAAPRPPGGGTRARFDAAGRRLPPGPPPPRSWLIPGGGLLGDEQQQRGLAERRREEKRAHADALERVRLPGTYYPDRGSLVDMVLRRTVADWEVQASCNRFHLYALSTRLRSALIRAVSLWADGGLSIRDLRLILLPPSAEELRKYRLASRDEADGDGHGIGDGDGGIENGDDGDEPAAVAPAVLNEDLVHLDLSGSLGRSLKLRELSDLLFSSRKQQTQQQQQPPPDSGPQECWDADDASTSGSQPPLSIQPSSILPSLTHLSLAIPPPDRTGEPSGGVPAHTPSWRQLLAFASRLPGLTHLSLANWPEPALTPRDRFSIMVPLLISAAGPVLHTPDDDFTEAVAVLRRLSRSLYRLEHLDLTGCLDWAAPALTRPDAAGNLINWTVDWSNVAVLRISGGEGATGGNLRFIDEVPVGFELDMEPARRNLIEKARAIQRHVRGRRGGKGSGINVMTDGLDGGGLGMGAGRWGC